MKVYGLCAWRWDIASDAERAGLPFALAAVALVATLIDPDGWLGIIWNPHNELEDANDPVLEVGFKFSHDHGYISNSYAWLKGGGKP